jgi:hypothetical protein
MKTRLTVLEDLRIATPCNADWDDMTGDERVRFCGKCEKNVYNLSAMARDEAERLVREREGRVCVRFFQRRDGTVLTSDCPVGVQRKRLRQRVWASLSGAAASLSLFLGLAAGRARADLTLRDGKRPAGHHVPLMGGPVANPHPSPAPVMMGEPAMLPPPPPKHVLMGKPSMPHPVVGKIMLPEHERIEMMGDISVEK